MVVVVVVVGVAVGAAVLLRGASTPDPVGQRDPATQAEDGWAVPAVVEPLADAAPFPASGLVGKGALVYACRECGTRLVLADGTQRLLAREMDAAAPYYGLSPDGRWLFVPGASAVTVRDLTGDRSHRVAGAGDALIPWAWSPDSRWLVLAEWDGTAHATGPTGYRLLDLTDGTAVELDAPEGREFVAVLPSGVLWAADVVRGSQDTTPVREVNIAVVDPASSGATDSFTIDAGRWLEGGETLAEVCGSCGGDWVRRSGVQLLPVSAGEGLHLGVFHDRSPSALLRVSGSGQVEERLDIAFAEPRRLAWIAGRLGDEVLVAQMASLHDRVAFEVSLYAVTPDGLREVTRLEPAKIVRLAGAAVHGGSAGF